MRGVIRARAGSSLLSDDESDLSSEHEGAYSSMVSKPSRVSDKFFMGIIFLEVERIVKDRPVRLPGYGRVRRYRGAEKDDLVLCEDVASTVPSMAEQEPLWGRKCTCRK